MEFLFVFFCVIWLIYRGVTWKATISLSEAKQKKHIASKLLYRQEFEATKERESEIDAFISDLSRREELYKELEPDLLDIFGEDYREKFDLNQKFLHKQNPLFPSSGRFNPNPNKFHAKQLLLSHEGKISHWDVLLGFKVVLYNGKDLDIAVYRRIEKNMRSLGHNFTLVSSMDYIKQLGQDNPRRVLVDYVYLVPEEIAITEVKQRWWPDDVNLTA